MTTSDIIDHIELLRTIHTEATRQLKLANEEKEALQRELREYKNKEAADLLYWRDKFSPQGTMRLVRKDGFEKLVPHHDELPPIYRVAQVPEGASILDASTYRAPEHLTFKFERFMLAPHGSRAKIAIYHQF